MRRAAFAGAALALLAGQAGAEDYPELSFPSEPQGYTAFAMPSGNVECIYTPAGGSSVYKTADAGPELSCDRASPKYLRFTLTAHGKAEMLSDVGDQSCCGAKNILPYGRSWRGGPFYCESAEDGLTCMTEEDHGFLISRKKVKAY